MSRFAFVLVGAILLVGNHTISEYLLRVGLGVTLLPMGALMESKNTKISRRFGQIGQIGQQIPHAARETQCLAAFRPRRQAPSRPYHGPLAIGGTHPIHGSDARQEAPAWPQSRSIVEETIRPHPGDRRLSTLAVLVWLPSITQATFKDRKDL